MMFKNIKITTIAFSGLFLMGCVPVGYPSYYNQQEYASAYQNYVPAQTPAAAPAQDPQPQIQYATSPRVMSELNGLQERVRRVERAMIRLDRRMQLIERNELSRMSSEHMEGAGTPPVSGMFQPMSYKGEGTSSAPQQGAYLNSPASVTPVKMPSLQSSQLSSKPSRVMPFQRHATLQNVSMNAQTNPNMITSSLQVAPKKVAYHAGSASSGAQASRLAGLPSLADKKHETKADSVSVWTIRYQDEKIWPERSELKDSHSVIQALRGGEPVALFARGARPASKEFRERVRAVSKYLSKVSDLDNVPIASMPAKYMDEDTIEILVTK